MGRTSEELYDAFGAGFDHKQAIIDGEDTPRIGARPSHYDQELKDAWEAGYVQAGEQA